MRYASFAAEPLTVRPLTARISQFARVALLDLAKHIVEWIPALLDLVGTFSVSMRS